MFALKAFRRAAQPAQAIGRTDPVEKASTSRTKGSESHASLLSRAFRSRNWMNLQDSDRCKDERTHRSVVSDSGLQFFEQGDNCCVFGL